MIAERGGRAAASCGKRLRVCTIDGSISTLWLLCSLTFSISDENPVLEDRIGRSASFFNGEVCLKGVKRGERVGHKPGSVLDGHLSGRTVSSPFERFLGSGRAALCHQRHCFRSLHQPGFTWPESLGSAGGLLPHRCTIACSHCCVIGCLHFCGTLLAVTRTGRYPAVCPVEPGLSSGISMPATVCPTLSVSLL